MFLVELSALLSRLNSHCYRGLEGAAVLAQSRRQHEVEIEHLLVRLLEDERSDIPQIFSASRLSLTPVLRGLRTGIEQKPGGEEDRPEVSPYLAQLIQDGWLLASLEYKSAQLRSGHLLLALLQQPARYKVEGRSGVTELLRALNHKVVRGRFDELVRDSAEQSAPLTEGTSATPAAVGDSQLQKFTVDLTADARAGRLDEVSGRDAEIDQLISILSRRRKNNPLIVGEAGVGKTALVEGLAQRIASGQVHGGLREVTIRSLDLGLLQAGAGLRGEFESRMTAIIREVKESPRPLILFIDEAHMLIGAGNQAGGGDAANLLKPALARGDLRTIAATTWTEYKKYFEKDAALRRRFQMVKVEEPGRPLAVAMLAEVVPRYERSHGVFIRHDALVAAVELSSRYIAGRLLPDKAVDLVDRCAAYVRIRQTQRPSELDRLHSKLAMLTRELTARRRDRELSGVVGEEELELRELGQTIERLQGELTELAARYEIEQKAYEQVVQLRQELTPGAATSAQTEALRTALTELKKVQREVPLVPLEVDPEVVAAVIAEETNIPVGRLISSEVVKLDSLEQNLERRVKGQSESLKVIANRIRSARMELQDPKRPVGVFLLVGPSGTGKTETALAVADQLFGGEQFMTTINMSEYLEEHAVSRLIGSPPGYVGYEEGGVLSDAIRQRPYSVVLLDEVEKAKRPVMNLFYQVFDRGSLNDGQGRPVDFRNTVIFMTSNLGTELTMEMTARGARRPALVDLQRELVDGVLRPYFSPALLARMTVLPYYPLGRDVLAEILEMKLGQVSARVQHRYRIQVSYTQAVRECLMGRASDVDSGARVLDHLIREEMVPRLTSYVMSHLGGAVEPSLTIDCGAGDSFVVVPSSAHVETSQLRVS